MGGKSRKQGSGSRANELRRRQGNSQRHHGKKLYKRTASITKDAELRSETGKQVVGCFCALIFLFILIGVIVWVSLGSLEGGDLAPDAAADAANDAADAATGADTASTS